MDTLNIAAYKFIALNDLPALQSAVQEQAQGLALKGTVLLADEGINLFLAGRPSDVSDFWAWLQADTRFADLQAKSSWSSHQPFKKLLVKVKPEFIRMNHPAIRPTAGRAPSVDAATLKRWLDQGHDDTGRPVVTLDTRNAFEVDVGTFDGAIDWRIGKFTDFPRALIDHQLVLAGKTVVSFLHWRNSLRKGGDLHARSRRGARFSAGWRHFEVPRDGRAKPLQWRLFCVRRPPRRR